MSAPQKPSIAPETGSRAFTVRRPLKKKTAGGISQPGEARQGRVSASCALGDGSLFPARVRVTALSRTPVLPEATSVGVLSALLRRCFSHIVDHGHDRGAGAGR
jgi:hypothetical protein